MENKVIVSLIMCKGVSKNTGVEYDYLNVDVKDFKGHCVSILDFKGSIPYDVKDLECSIVKTDKGRYVIEELDYYIPFQYNLGIRLLINNLGKE